MEHAWGIKKMEHAWGIKQKEASRGWWIKSWKRNIRNCKRMYSNLKMLE